MAPYGHPLALALDDTLKWATIFSCCLQTTFEFHPFILISSAFVEKTVVSPLVWRPSINPLNDRANLGLYIFKHSVFLQQPEHACCLKCLCFTFILIYFILRQPLRVSFNFKKFFVNFSHFILKRLANVKQCYNLDFLFLPYMDKEWIIVLTVLCNT